MVYCGERKEIMHYITIATESPDEKVQARALHIKARLENLQKK